jgi:hypothetical protein
VSKRRVTALVLALLLLAAPAAALADGAGDEQYQDPLTAPAAPKKKASTPKPAKTVTAPATSAPSASTSGSVGSSQSAATTPSSSSGSSASELPRTGFPAGRVAVVGALLIACGLALRRRTSAA